MKIIKVMLNGKEVEEQVLEENEFETNDEVENIDDSIIIEPIKEDKIDE